MTQNREPPAFQEYAATMMASIDFRTMSLAARGLLYTMRLECWVNRRLPADPAKLARMLGFDVAQVAAVLPDVMGFFGTDGAFIFCQELDDYRLHLERERKRKSEGGKLGAKLTNAKRSGESSGSPPNESSGNPAGEARATRRASRGSSRESLVQNSQIQNSPIHAIEGGVDHHWLNDYERASRGN